MKLLSLFAFVCLGSMWAQTTPASPVEPAPALANLPDDEVVAVFDDGAKFTMGDFKKIWGALPPEVQKMALQDRRGFLQRWAFTRKLAKLAEAEKLDQESPTKELLQYNRMSVLTSAELNKRLTSTTVDSPEIVNYYNDHKEDYKQVKLSAIYVAFGSGKKLSEEQAKAKAEKLLGQLRGGADFVKLVRENSDDETSRAKDGDFLTLHPGDNVPDAMRAAVFKLKDGEISEPVKQPNGFYLFRADKVTYSPLSQVRDQIFSTLKDLHYKEWLDKTNKETKVTFTSPAFLGLVPVNPGSK